MASRGDSRRRPGEGRTDPGDASLCGNQIPGAFVLNRRVDLHAIDRRLLDGVAMSVPPARRSQHGCVIVEK